MRSESHDHHRRNAVGWRSTLDSICGDTGGAAANVRLSHGVAEGKGLYNRLDFAGSGDSCAGATA